METISVCMSLSWTHPPHLSATCLSLSSRSGPVMPALQQASGVWINLPGWLLIWRWVDRHPPTPKLISLCHCMTPPPPIPADTHTCTHIHKYLHLSLSHLHGRGQEGGWLVRERKVSALKEFIILRCQSRSLGEQMKRRRRRGWEEASNGKRREGFYICLVIGYEPKVCHGLRSWLAGIHCVQLNHHIVCVSPSRVVFDCILIMRNLRTHTSCSGYGRSFGGQKHTRGFVETTEAGNQTHKRAHLVIPKWSSQCVHHTCWRLAWGKQLLIASNPLQFVWDHLSSLLCFSVVALWKPIGWQLMYGLLQSPQPGLRDPATLFSPRLLSISSSFAFVLS